MRLRLSRRPHRALRPATLLIVLLASPALSAASLGGARVQWQMLTMNIVGPSASETDDAPNPFLDLRAEVHFVSPSGQRAIVPAFFAGNGRGHGTGNIWRVRFTPDEPGNWSWSIDFRSGPDVAVAAPRVRDQAATIGEHGVSGTVSIAPRDPRAPGLLAEGRIDYVGEHYLKQRDGDWWLKGGVDSPENFFGYAGFDNTVDQPGGAATPSLPDGLHRYAAHVDDWRDGDPDFASTTTGVNSRGIVGAVNYLADQGINSLYFLPMNLGGDGRDTYPFIGASGSAFDNTHYDVSKLAQWQQVLEHMQRRGINAHIVLSETEVGNTDWLDDGELGVQRKLFFRELVARFAYLNGVKWNLGEESRYGSAREIDFAAWLRELDWADHPLAVHTHRDRPEQRYEALLGNTDFDTTSIQFSADKAELFTETWRARSAAAGWKWVVEMDELGPGGTGVTDSNMEALRRTVLYPVYFSGGSLEWYFGYHALPLGGDLQTEDFRTREPMYRWTRIARQFLQDHTPLPRMEPADDRLLGAQAGDQVFSAAGDTHALYLLDGTAGRRIELAAGEWQQRWFDPRTGVFDSVVRPVSGGMLDLGEAPAEQQQDWVVLLRRSDDGDAPDGPDGPDVEPIDAQGGEPLPVVAAPDLELGAARASDDGGGSAGLALLGLLGATIATRRRRSVYCATAHAHSTDT